MNEFSSYIGSIYNKIFKDIEHVDAPGTDLVIAKAPHHNERVSLQRRIISELNVNRQEGWDCERGDYSTEGYRSLLNSEAMRLIRATYPRLNGDELYIAHHIRALLNNANQEGPLKVADVGGMYGLSWVKIAREFEKEIEEGKLEMIVTNLHFDPNKGRNIKRSRGESYSRMSEDNYIIWEESRHLVSYINCTTKDLPASLDLIYENLSATRHSYTPSVERANILTHLKPGGRLITNDNLEAKVEDNNILNKDVLTDLQNFNEALKKSSQFILHKSIKVGEKRFKLSKDWKMISKKT